MRYEVLEKRQRLNEEFWRSTQRMCQIRKRMHRLLDKTTEQTTDRTITSMLRELTTLPAREISSSRKRPFPSEQVAHCSLPAMSDEVVEFINQLEAELEELQKFSEQLIALEHEMRDQRLNDWHKYPVAEAAADRRADIEGINRLRRMRDSKTRHRR